MGNLHTSTLFDLRFQNTYHQLLTGVQTTMGSLGFPELMILLVIVIVIFGATRLPQLGKGLGEGIRNFKDSLKGDDNKIDKP